MKFLSIPRLASLSNTLSSLELSDQRLQVRVEAYSCKQARVEKKLSKEIERNLERSIENEYPSMSPILSGSPLGPLNESSTRKLLVSLITTMNASFPDYDFSRVGPDQFNREPHFSLIQHSLNSLFLQSSELIQPGIRTEFWQALDETIGLESCEFYRWQPSTDSDLVTGQLWSVYYFLYNKREKKILFIAAQASSNLHRSDTLEDTEEDEIEEMDYLQANESSEDDQMWHALEWEQASTMY
jgi:hypothetical protein